MIDTYPKQLSALFYDLFFLINFTYFFDVTCSFGLRVTYNAIYPRAIN
jgi:hypothetical protein